MPRPKPEKTAMFRRYRDEWLVEIITTAAHYGRVVGVRRRDGSIAWVRLLEPVVTGLDRGRQLWRFERAKAPLV
jgi:hypothetical protein